MTEFLLHGLAIVGCAVVIVLAATLLADDEDSE